MIVELLNNFTEFQKRDDGMFNINPNKTTSKSFIFGVGS